MEKIFGKLKKIPLGAIPIVVAMAVIPLIVHYYEFEAHLSMMSWYVENDKTGDLFNYYKSEWLTALAGIMIIMVVLGPLFSKRYSLHKAMIPLGIYAIWIIFSTLVTDYQYFSLNGMDNHFETTYVLLSYCMVCLFSYWFADSERAVKFIMYAWMIGIAIMGVIGIFQLVGHDLYSTEFGKFLIIPTEMRETKDIIFNFDSGVVYLTLYNPNYVGFYATLTIPILTVLFIFSKSIGIKIISIVLNSVVFLCLMGSGARNGMIAVAVALAFMLICFRKKLKTHWLGFVIAYASMIAIFIGFNIVNDGMVAERLEAGFQVETDAETFSGELEDIATNDDNVVITYSGEELTLQMPKDPNEVLKSGMIMQDSDGKDVEKESLGGESISYKIKDERFPFTVTVGQVAQKLGFAVDINGKTWCFSNQTEFDGYYFYSPYGKFTKIEKADSAIFTNYSNLASGRGYLWARSIPLLKKYFMFGSGPDTFTVVFPQKDYVAASKLGYDKLTVTKPHNLYLQIGVQTGVISLVAFLALNVIYLLECLKLYWKRKSDSYMEYIGVAIMIAIIGYLISGIINDSTITVAPIYWCLIGIGLAVNRVIKKRDVA